MTEHHALTAESILWALPDVLRRDEVTYALGEAIAKELDELACKTDLPTIYSNIDTLDEDLLDIMAKDFKIDWWRPDAAIEWKRQTMKDCWFVHKHLGTPAAVKAAIAEFLGKGVMQEWYEYEGIPHHFRIRNCDNDEVIRNYQVFRSILHIVKRGSSMLDRVTALLTYMNHFYVGMATRIRKVMVIGCDEEDLVLNILTDESENPLTTQDGGVLYL